MCWLSSLIVHAPSISVLLVLSQNVGCCAGDLSRNRTVGIRLGKGEKLQDIVDSMKAVAEGVLTSRSAYQLARCATPPDTVHQF